MAPRASTAAVQGAVERCWLRRLCTSSTFRLVALRRPFSCFSPSCSRDSCEASSSGSVSLSSSSALCLTFSYSPECGSRQLRCAQRSTAKPTQMWYLPATKSPRRQCMIIDIMEPEGKEKYGLTYTREDLMLSAFILHAHAEQRQGYLECLCDHQCKYFMLNEERKLEHDYEQYEQRQVFEESRNKGYPDELTRLVMKEDLGLFEFLTEIYSVYRHLEIAHKVFAELAMETKFGSESEKKQHWLGWGFDSVHFTYFQNSTHYVFTVTVKLSSSQDVEELELIVGKAGFEASQQLEPAVVSENQCIVFFSWLLTAEDIFEAGLEGCKQALASIRCNKPGLEGKLSAIRRRSLCRLYDLSSFY